MPVYNAEATIARMIDSILAQTFKDWELIAVDDGSTDNSGDILDVYAKRDCRIRVVHKSNGGVASARQIGIDSAMGEYTIHADSDDWIEPTMLEDMIAKARQDDADIVIADYYNDNGKGKIERCIQKPASLAPLDVLHAIYAKDLFGGLWHKLIKKSSYDKAQARFAEGIDYCEDVLVLTQLLLYANPKICYLPKAYYHYVVNPTSLTQHVTLKGFESMKKFHAAALAILPDNVFRQTITDKFEVEEFMTYFMNRLYTSNRELKKIYLALKPLLIQHPSLRWRMGYRCIELGAMSLAHSLIRF